jgi:hypothetical protein
MSNNCLLALSSHCSKWPELFVNHAENQELFNKLVKNVAIESLQEFAVSLALTGITCFFVATPGGIAILLATTVTIVAINALIRSGAAYCAYRYEQLDQLHSEDAEQEKEAYRFVIKAAEYLCPLSFSILDSTTRDVLIHEGGHALAATLLFKGANPSITINPLEGGVTRYYQRGLTSLGEMLGTQKADFIISAAGTAASLGYSLLNIILADRLAESHPQLSKYLLVMGITSILNSIIYAASALFTAFPGHDFAALWRGGLHPVASIAMMVLLPLIVKGILFAIDYSASPVNSSLSLPV